MNLTNFSLQLDKDIAIQGEYEGNLESGRAVVFVHGFGVKRDSWGMFTELGDSLKNDFLVVRFDLVEILESENATKVHPLSTQAKMLDKVLEYVRQMGVSEINLISHSQGCLVTGLLLPDNIHKCILLASPVESPYMRMKAYFASRPETIIDETGLSKIKRSDGSWTLLDSGYWDELRDIKPDKLFEDLSKKTEIYFVRAQQDHVLTDESHQPIQAIKSINYLELPGDHNFAGDARQGWIDKMVEII